MKTITCVLMMFAGLFLTSCGPSAAELEQMNAEQKLTMTSTGRKPQILGITKIDGCEYFLFQGYYADFCTHKGNCSNPIHYNNSKIKYINKGQNTIDSIVVNDKTKELFVYYKGFTLPTTYTIE